MHILLNSHIKLTNANNQLCFVVVVVVEVLRKQTIQIKNDKRNNIKVGCVPMRRGDLFIPYSLLRKVFSESVDTCYSIILYIDIYNRILYTLQVYVLPSLFIVFHDLLEGRVLVRRSSLTCVA